MNYSSILEYKDNIIKYSKNSIIFYDNEYVYKQYVFNDFKWARELFIVNSLKNANIIKFNKCFIINDFVIEYEKSEINLAKKEKMIRISMRKYQKTLDAYKDLTDVEIIYIIKCLLNAILYYESHGIIHRDIKEQNVVLNTKNNFIKDVVLIDFNLACLLNENMNCNIITKTHRPPEISLAIKNNCNIKYDSRVDVWSFCILLSFMVTGKQFYKFLKRKYIEIDNFLVCDLKKIKREMKIFLKKHSNNLSHLKFYKTLIIKGIELYEKRITFKEISDLLDTYFGYSLLTNKYNVKNLINNEIVNMDINNLISYKYFKNNDFVKKNITLIKNIFFINFNYFITKNLLFNSTYVNSLFIFILIFLEDPEVFTIIKKEFNITFINECILKFLIEQGFSIIIRHS